MAKQHIYARVSEGLYTKKVGFDTVAVSCGLDETYVKENIHRFCFYNEHNFLDDEKNIMPNIYFASHVKSIDLKYETLIFGKNSYVKENRSSFISHSIIVSSIEELKYTYDNFDNILSFDRFSEATNLKILKDIDFKTLNNLDLFFTRDLFFEYLGITKEIYCSILHYTILSIIERKSLYININCKRSYCSEISRQLLRLIFFNIPIELKKHLSFISYTSTLNLSNFFNIVFVDKNISLEQVNNGYVVDFTQNNVFLQNEIYLNFAWSNIIHSNKIILNYGIYYKNIELLINKERMIELLNKSVESDIEKFKNILCNNVKDEKMLLRSKSSYFFYVIITLELQSLGKINVDLFLYLKQYLITNKEIYFEKFSFENEYILNLFFRKLEKNQSFIDFGNLFLIYDCYNDIYNYISNDIKQIKTYERFVVVSYFYLTNLKKYFFDKKYNHLNNRINELIILKANSFSEIDLKNNKILNTNILKEFIAKDILGSLC